MFSTSVQSIRRPLSRLTAAVIPARKPVRRIRYVPRAPFPSSPHPLMSPIPPARQCRKMLLRQLLLLRLLPLPLVTRTLLNRLGRKMSCGASSVASKLIIKSSVSPSPSPQNFRAREGAIQLLTAFPDSKPSQVPSRPMLFGRVFYPSSTVTIKHPVRTWGQRTLIVGWKS